jgi:molybdate transport system substrate-binding protein
MLASGCGTAAPASSPTSGAITVLAAASLTSAFNAVAQRFEQDYPGVQVRLSFAGSQQLVSQIESGVPADVFASADLNHMNQVRQAGKVESPVLFARNSMVIIIPAANPAGISQPYDLAKAGVKLDLAAPVVPAGALARQVLARLATEPSAPEDFMQAALRNVVSEESDVEAVVSRVALNEVDAGIVYVSDLKTANGSKVKAISVPGGANVSTVYPIAVISGSPNASLARQFVAFLRGATAQRILRNLGFLPPN